MHNNISGILLLDKPIGLTSNEALQVVKKLFKVAKAGHTGSLDPIATGMLPLCFGEATKFSQFLLESDKRYLVTGKLGEVTPSGDSETPVSQKREVNKIKAKELEKVLSQFRGEISQIPPMYSAIKHQGQPLYKLVRQGIEVPREPRKINIYSLELSGLDGDLLTLNIHCSKGTYVRTLVVDIGEALGCGAHVVALRRTTVGSYQDGQMVTLEKLREIAANKEFTELNRYILPIETMLVGMTELTLTSDMSYYACTGQPILIPNAPSKGWIKLKTKDGKFLGVGEVMLDGKIAPRKMVKQRFIHERSIEL